MRGAVLADGGNRKTSNVERRTLNVERRREVRLQPCRRSTFDVRRSTFLLSLLTPALLAAEPALLTEARRALGESIPLVAIYKVRTALADTALPPDQHAAATLLLGRALLGAGRHAEALSAIAPLVAAGDAAALGLRAHVLAGAGRWAEALPLFHTLAAAPDAPLTARVGEAESLYALGRTDEAAAALAEIVRTGPATNTLRLRLAGMRLERMPSVGTDAGRQQIDSLSELLAETIPVTPEEAKWKLYVEGRLGLAQGWPDAAREVFERILPSENTAREREHLPESLLAAATFGITDAWIALHGHDAADKWLETFIWRYPESAYLELVFQRLDQVYAQQENPREAELHNWVKKQSSPAQMRRAAFAQFYVAKMQVRERKYDKATVSLESFARSHPDHLLLPQAHLLQADVAAARGNLADAARALEAAMRRVQDPDRRAEIELRAGLVAYQQGEHLLAANLYESAARRAPRIGQIAQFNEALASLSLKHYDRFREEYRAFSASYPESGLRSELILEEGLVQARSLDPRAQETLKNFLAQFPKHAREGEARLALAELAFASVESGAPVQLAMEGLVLASAAPQTPSTAEHGEYLALFLEDARPERDEAEVIRKAQRFIEEHPKSPLLAEVRMKLGQVYFRREDYANAETQFGTLAREAPDSAHAEAALFLAAQSAMKLQIAGSSAVDRALELFDQVVKREGPLKLYARQEQASLQTRLGHEAEAITLGDLILVAQPPAAPELRHAALCGKGDNLVALGRKELPKTERLVAAIAAFDQLATQPEAPATWRNQALYKKAKALELLGRVDEASLAFYEVLEKSAAVADREYFWSGKAGFDAARLYETQEQWRSALGIYEKLAKLGGPRSAEAQARGKQLGLEHFIPWD